MSNLFIKSDIHELKGHGRLVFIESWLGKQKRRLSAAGIVWTRENTDAALKPACPFPCRHRQCQGATALLPEPGCCLRNLQRSLRRDSTRWTELACKLFASLECGVAFFLRGQRRASLGTLRRKREGNEWTQLWIPQPPSLPIRLYILLHACKCKSVISLSQSFLINVFFYFLKRWRTRLPISLAWHPGRLFKIQGQPAFPVPSAPAPYRAVLPACSPSFGCPEHLSCCCLEWPFLPQCPTVLVFVSFQNSVHVAPFLLCLFIRAHLQLSSLKLNWRNCCK